VIYINTAATNKNFLAPLPGIEEEEEAPTSTILSHINLAPAMCPLPSSA
jgi:hypothetical protein